MIPKDIAIVYNPSLISEYVSNNVASFRYPDPEATKAITKAAKSRPIGMTPMKGEPLARGINWIDEEYLTQGIQSSGKGQDWLARGILRLVSKRPLEGETDIYNGTIADYKGKEGSTTEYTNVRLIIANTYDRSYLVTLKNQCPALFQGEGIMVVQKACDEQIKRIDSQFSASVNVGDFYRSMQTA